MKKFLTSATFVVVFSAYALYQNFGNASADTPQNMPVSSRQIDKGSLTQVTPDASPAKPTPVSIPQPTPTPIPAPKPKGQYIDGTYTGNEANAYYGYIKVQATISNGELANVQFLQYPNDRNRSIEINNYAMPILGKEAIQVQGAQVDGVSGASDTSVAFRESLASALAQAKS